MKIIAINFKAYMTGQDAVSLAATCNQVATETSSTIWISVPATDIYHISQTVSLPVFAEHIDPVTMGAHTGSITTEEIKQNGAKGTLINHSEDMQSIEEIEKIVKLCAENSLLSIVCVPSLEMALEVVAFNPDVIAYEPPELIGGDVSVTTRPQIIKELVSQLRAVSTDVKIFVGAGVKNQKDINLATSLGCDGVLLASGVTKSDNPEKVLREMLSDNNSDSSSD